ncbi:MAG: histone deacetylase [Candidatus Zixiibacteriota bacterium]
MNQVGIAVTLGRDTHPAPPGHPENYNRLALVTTALAEAGIKSLTTNLDVREFDASILKRVHDSAYVDSLQNYRRSEIKHLDPDTFMGPLSYAASCGVTWAALSAVDEAFGGGPRVSFIIGRPPGHHAETDRAMGFCLVNHVAVAAQYALDSHNCRRVAVVDFDVHHGNGTQHLFYDRSNVLYISTHQSPFYPGTGAIGEQGVGDGLGHTMNFPFWAGAGDAELVGVFQSEISGALIRYEPDIIIVSAGFDGHYLDPLGGFSLTGEGYRQIGICLRQAADHQCGSRLVSVLEGGYNPEANVDSITNYIRGIALA